MSLAFLLLGFSNANSTVVQASVTSSMQSRIDNLVHRTSNRQGVPGISAAVIGYGMEKIYSSHGVIRRGSNNTVDEDTLFSLGSLSKAFSAMGILYLDQSSDFPNFSIDDPIQDHIPWLNFRHRAVDFDMSELKVRNFVYHTSGLVNAVHSLQLPPSNGENAAYNIVRRLNNSRLEFRPGTRYDYASSNYIVIGLIIQHVTGISFEEFIETNILLPLGLANTFLFESDAKERGIMATAHKPTWFASRPFSPPTFRAHTPTGFIISSASDMARWMELFFNPSIAPVPFNDLLVRALEPNTSVAAVNGNHYAAGWLINEETGKIRHEGESPGFLSEIVMLPASGIGVIILKNSSAGDAANLMENILLLLDGEQPGEISAGSDFRMLDIIFASYVFAAVLAMIFLVFFTILKIISIRKRTTVKVRPRARSWVNLVLASLFFIGLLVTTIILPSMLGVGTWAIASVWAPSTILTGLVITTIAGAVWVAFAIFGMLFRKPKKIVKH